MRTKRMKRLSWARKYIVRDDEELFSSCTEHPIPYPTILCSMVFVLTLTNTWKISHDRPVTTKSKMTWNIVLLARRRLILSLTKSKYFRPSKSDVEDHKNWDGTLSFLLSQMFKFNRRSFPLCVYLSWNALTIGTYENVFQPSWVVVDGNAFNVQMWIERM